jgi:hypothetical protein
MVARVSFFLVGVERFVHRTRVRRACVGCVLSVALATGCGGSRLERYSSAQIGCRPDQIEISEVQKSWGTRNWVATCQGQAYHCAMVATGNNATQIDCTPESGPAAGAPGPTPVVTTSAPPPQPVRTPASAVTRHDTERGIEIRASLEVGAGFQLHVVTSPTRAPDQALFVLKRARRPDARQDCNLRLMIDGEIVDPGTARYEIRGVEEFLAIQTQFAVVERIVGAQRIVGRVCNDEVAIDGAGRAVLGELVSRVREEAAFVAPPQPASTATGSVPDAGTAP